MNQLFSEVAHLNKQTQKLKKDSLLHMIAPNDRLGNQINSRYLQDEGHFNSSEEARLAFVYFDTDFQRTYFAFLNAVEDLGKVLLNKPEFFNSRNYLNRFSRLENYIARAELDYSALLRFRFLRPEKKPFSDRLDFLFDRMKEVVGYELDFPGLGLRMENSFVLIAKCLVSEKYEQIINHKEKSKKVIETKYASSSPGFLQLFDERFSEIVYVSQNR